MSTKLHHFLLVYSYDEGKLVHEEEFLDEKLAAAAYTAAENKYRDELQKLEIVLVGSDSIETIMRTHGHYFAGRDLMAPFSSDLANRERAAQ